MHIEEFIINVYVLVDDFLKKYGDLRERGPKPKVSDAEIITRGSLRERADFLARGLEVFV